MSHAKPIDLGKTFNDIGAIAVSVGDEPDKKHYPDLYLSDVDDPSLLDLPDEGVAEIHFKVVSRSHHEENRHGDKKRTCSLTLEVRSIEPGHDPKFNGKARKSWGDDARKSFSSYFKDK